MGGVGGCVCVSFVSKVVLLKTVANLRHGTTTGPTIGGLHWDDVRFSSLPILVETIPTMNVTQTE